MTAVPARLARGRNRLRPIQRLNLTLFVHTQHDRAIRRHAVVDFIGDWAE